MQLSDRQQRTVATAVTIVAGMVILAAVLSLLWLLAVFVGKFSQVLLPLAVAGITALVFQPYYEWLRLRLRLPMPLAVAALFLSALVPIGLFVGFFGVVLFREFADFLQDFPGWWDELTARLQQHWPEMQKFFAENPLGKRIAGAMEEQDELLASVLEYFAATGAAAGAGVAERVSGMLSWVVTPVYFVFFLIAKRKDLSRLEDFLPFLKPATRQDVVFLAQEFVNIVVAFFRGQIIIAFLQGLLFAIGFSLVGLQYGAVLGFVLGFLNVIPYLGSMLGLSITLPLAYFQEGGGLLMLAGVILVFSAVQAIEGYLLTPRIMGHRTGLHPMAIIFAVFFWGTALGGILGMILAIPLTAFLVVFWRLVKEKYISELV
ncbi:MAG: AI-2E family transporter [Planctomycetales bacterium]|nr:AI-2E family transporter [Planctomycetales bacterium]NIM07872.1 AI-2E family transporter [Planctomycetales bacterium]NIN07358.1 AI-2E family transporter [Planctomycetales bacterium]NIN76462.1 AI-2E family transporter [Planctomycetales bacterium]NIO33653.1 AI-2E family transporter [Planctomycetales bacterium]